MKIPWTIPLIALAGVLTAREPDVGSLYAEEVAGWDAHTENTVRQRLQHLDIPFSYTGNEDEVVHQIRLYLVNGRRDTERMLGRSKVFFPIFEHNLQRAGLPEDLKYIPVIETGLNPHLRSRAGAHGMWQMMYGTARFFDLRINSEVDERYDVYKSTEGAIRMLQYLYEDFEDWALVIAAYNAGSGKVKRAIRKANCPEYRFIRRYLPSETQKYLVRYVAAAYVGKYYAAHGLEPAPVPTVWRNTRVLPVAQYLNLKEAAKVSGVAYETLRELNRGYHSGYLPHTIETPNYLVLPARGVAPLSRHLDEKNNRRVAGGGGRVLVKYVVSPGDDLSGIARLFQVKPSEIEAWNHLQGRPVQAFQELNLYLPKDYLLNRA